MICPQCGAENNDAAWNCEACRINLYWAVQHFDALANIRLQQGRPTEASSEPFLIDAHKRAMGERTPEKHESKVRAVARKVIQRKTATSKSTPAA